MTKGWTCRAHRLALYINCHLLMTRQPCVSICFLLLQKKDKHLGRLQHGLKRACRNHQASEAMGLMSGMPPRNACISFPPHPPHLHTGSPSFKLQCRYQPLYGPFLDCFFLFLRPQDSHLSDSSSIYCLFCSSVNKVN